MIKVKIAELHSAITINGTKVLGAITVSKGKYPSISKLWYDVIGLHVETDAGKHALVPAPNVKFVTYDQSDE